jgi:hypothetical protein
LYWESVSLPGDRAKKKVQEFLWEKFRRELSRHFDPKDLERSDRWRSTSWPSGSTSLHPKSFGTLPKRSSSASRARKCRHLDGLFKRLLYLTPEELRAGLKLKPALTLR